MQVCSVASQRGFDGSAQSESDTQSTHCPAGSRQRELQSVSLRHSMHAERSGAQNGRSPLVQSASALHGSAHCRVIASQTRFVSQFDVVRHSTQRPRSQKGSPPLAQSVFD